MTRIFLPFIIVLKVKYACKEYFFKKGGDEMNSVIMFRKKAIVDFDYLKLGDVFRSREQRNLKVFIKGEVAKYIYVKKHGLYRIIVRVLYYDLKENKFSDE
ncbi:MAG: hypothetical protein IJW82_05735 [Clostridia bacterium]|nr:hypothetical protein [Clostridia bacterium]